MSTVLILPLLAVLPLEVVTTTRENMSASEGVNAVDSPEEGQTQLAAYEEHQCAALFGGRDDEGPRDHTTMVSRSTHTVDVTYGESTWQTPRLVSLPGIEFVRSEEVDDGSRRAVLRVGDEWAEECPAGEYAVAALAPLGVDGRILAVLEEGVLAEHRGALIFVPPAGRRGPAFRMIWRSGFGLSVNGSVGGGSTGAAKNNSAADKKARRQKRGRADKATVKATVANRRSVR
ncbi:MAG: hypothetical protein ACO3JL_10870 [Myxococcota bacterium]